ncbi:hypothetical protein C2E23DRAFT_464430 [Lenzites betulinus]|nr:hypothetical protein C2E23DRAFT_464430 [Lenzites betulinus]
MMPFRTFEGPRDVWISHYTSNRIGDSELNTILLSLIKQGVVMQVHSASEDKLRDVQDHGDDTDKHGDEDFAHNTDADHSDTDGKSRDGKSRDDSANDDHQTIDNTCTLSWAGFPTPAPSATSTNSGGKHAALHDTQTDHERLVFRLLECIGGAICATALPQLQPSCECIAEPLVTASEELASHSYRIDGGLKLLKTTSPQFPTVEASKTQPSDIVVNFSSKLQKGYMYELYLDRRWSASYEWVSHIMYNDCRRTHTYSITIEDTNIALWHFSRSHFAKSSDFISLTSVRSCTHSRPSFSRRPRNLATTKISPASPKPTRTGPIYATCTKWAIDTSRR